MAREKLYKEMPVSDRNPSGSNCGTYAYKTSKYDKNFTKTSYKLPARYLRVGEKDGILFSETEERRPSMELHMLYIGDVDEMIFADDSWDHSQR